MADVLVDDLIDDLKKNINNDLVIDFKAFFLY